MENRDKNECEIYRKHFEEKLVQHGNKLDEHDIRLDKLEQDRATIFAKIENLVDKLGLTNKLLFTLITALVGFFFYAVEHSIFR